MVRMRSRVQIPIAAPGTRKLQSKDSGKKNLNMLIYFKIKERNHGKEE